MRKQAIIVWALLMAAPIWAQQAPEAEPRDAGAAAGQAAVRAPTSGAPGSLAPLCDEFPGAEVCARFRGGRGGSDFAESGAGTTAAGPGAGTGNGFEFGPGAGMGGVPGAAQGSGHARAVPGTEFSEDAIRGGATEMGPGMAMGSGHARAVPDTELSEIAVSGGAAQMGPGVTMGGGPGIGGAEPRGFGGLLTDPRLPVETRDRLRDAYLRYVDVLIPRQAMLQLAQAGLAEALQGYPLDRQVVEAHWQAVQAASNALLRARMDHVAELQEILGEPVWNSLHSGRRGLPEQGAPAPAK